MCRARRRRRRPSCFARASCQEDDDVGTEPAPRTDLDPSLHRPLPTDRLVEQLVGVILIGDVDVGTGLNLVAEFDRPVADDVRATPDNASLANRHRGCGEHLLVPVDTGRQTDVRTDERLVTNGQIALVIDDALGSHQGGVIAKVEE